MTDPLIDPEELGRVFADCLHRDDEPTEGAVICEGITLTVGFHPGRLQGHAAAIHAWLDALPGPFHAEDAAHGGGGGWSFLNACNDRNDVQWTGLHMRVQELMLLGLGLERVAYCVPRSVWEALPGSMPYFVVKRRVIETQSYTTSQPASEWRDPREPRGSDGFLVIPAPPERKS